MKSDDTLVQGFCLRHRIRVVFADVADAALALAERHACGPSSSLVLAEGLVGVGLLGADVQEPSETVSLRVELDGPIGGLFVEATGAGLLRGYTDRKRLPDFDGLERLDLNDVVGGKAKVAVLRAKADGRVVSQASFPLASGSVRGAVEQYFAASLQIPTWVSLYVSSVDGRLERAQGLFVQCLPDGDREHFNQLGPGFADGSVTERLLVDASLDSVREVLDLPELRIDRSRPLAFGCRCSRERAEEALRAMSVAELNGIRRSGKPQHVACHMCGAEYAFDAEAIGAIIGRKGA